MVMLYCPICKNRILGFKCYKCHVIFKNDVWNNEDGSKMNEIMVKSPSENDITVFEPVTTQLSAWPLKKYYLDKKLEDTITDEERKVFDALANHKTFIWRTIPAISKETKLSEDVVNTILNYAFKDYILRNPKNENQYGYCERIKDSNKKPDATGITFIEEKDIIDIKKDLDEFSPKKYKDVENSLIGGESIPEFFELEEKHDKLKKEHDEKNKLLKIAIDANDGLKKNYEEKDKEINNVYGKLHKETFRNVELDKKCSELEDRAKHAENKLKVFNDKFDEETPDKYLIMVDIDSSRSVYEKFPNEYNAAKKLPIMPWKFFAFFNNAKDITGYREDCILIFYIYKDGKQKRTLIKIDPVAYNLVFASILISGPSYDGIFYIENFIKLWKQKQELDHIFNIQKGTVLKCGHDISCKRSNKADKEYCEKCWTSTSKCFDINY